MKLPALFAAAALMMLGARCARADEIRTVPFSFVSSPTGPIQETLLAPQFDPAHGTLNSVTLTFSDSFQFALEAFDSGAGALSVTAKEVSSFGGIPVPVENAFATVIPANQPIFSFLPPPAPSGTLTEAFGPNTAAFFAGTGTLPFSLTIAPPTVIQFSGPTATSVLAFGGISGTLTVDYAFTPAPSAAPEPATFSVAGLGLIALGAFRRRRTPTILG